MVVTEELGVMFVRSTPGPRPSFEHCPAFMWFASHSSNRSEHVVQSHAYIGGSLHCKSWAQIRRGKFSLLPGKDPVFFFFPRLDRALALDDERQRSLAVGIQSFGIGREIRLINFSLIFDSLSRSEYFSAQPVSRFRSRSFLRSFSFPPFSIFIHPRKRAPRLCSLHFSLPSRHSLAPPRLLLSSLRPFRPSSSETTRDSMSPTRRLATRPTIACRSF